MTTAAAATPPSPGPAPASGPAPAPASGGLRIVRIANFVAPASGGLRTALRELGAGYLAAGHEPVLIVPGPSHDDRRTAQGRVITLPGPVVPGSGGYRVLTGRRRLAALLESLAPDRLEVSDRTTLRWTGEWARHHRIPAVMVSHESVDGVLDAWGLPAGLTRPAADRLNRRTAYAYTRVVCTTEWAAREFARVGARNVVRAPLGVDLERCHPKLYDAVLRRELAGEAPVMLALCSRLHPEKRPDLALDALAALRDRGADAVLVVAGDGPLSGRLRRRAAERRLPVRFTGYIGDPAKLAALQACADVVLAPGPAETFGLAALEALACGTPVVASSRSAVPELLGDAGAVADSTGVSYADGVQLLLERPAAARRAAARERAERYPWRAAVDAFLTAHDALPAGTRGAVPAGAAARAATGPRSGPAAEGAAPAPLPTGPPVPAEGPAARRPAGPERPPARPARRAERQDRPTSASGGHR
ncbi:glycosyltransferase [Streptomyces aidingensis]|uniref:Alpha-1,6-mannosyltransferase n=1 Tax=Streptomyces aidingensis TaxID=910347 RepID=A0A1I1PEU6_9ACTN|nr:glycosyltransferase [Streptomyces aidingensis]SFD08327.1 alpha-1,6-mannosyltransferase [Streptomyces aidingensis]